jgi:transcriptional regulator with XRE-family HTH domain
MRLMAGHAEPKTEPRVSEAFHQKLAFVLKGLSISRGALAAELGIDKSVVGRWVSGRVRPTSHNLSRLSAYIGTRVEGFTTLDWERPISGLAVMLGASPEAARQAAGAADAVNLPLLAESRAVTARRGNCYEGIFRTTRPYAQYPGRFMHDAIMIRPGEEGDLRFLLLNGGVRVEGVVLLQQTQLFIISADYTSGAYAFGILNGVNTVKAGVLDGLLMWCSLDSLRTPTASAILVERVADLTGDVTADDAAFAELCAADPLAAEGSLSPEIINHLTRDIGPSQIANGGDWLLNLPIARSLSRGVGPAIPGFRP